MNELTSDEKKEIDRIHRLLSDRARKINSIIVPMELSEMRRANDLRRLRFFERFWDPEIQTATIHAVYDAAESLGKNPMEFVSDTAMESLTSISSALIDRFPYNAHALKMDLMNEAFVLVLEHPGREGFIASLVVDRSIYNKHEIKNLVTAAEGTPTPLTEGSL